MTTHPDDELRADTTPATGGEVTSYPISHDERPSDAVLAAVAARTGRDAVELPTLYDAVDPDALDDLLDRSSGHGSQSDVALSMQYAGFDVRVSERFVRLHES